MSKRVMKKVLEQRKDAQGKQIEEEIDTEFLQQEEQKKKKNFFNAALMCQDDSDPDEKEDIQKQEDNQIEQKQQPKNKKKKNKNKKNKEKLTKEEELILQDDQDIKFLDNQLSKMSVEESKIQEPLFQEGNVQLFGCLDIVLAKLNYNKEIQRHFKNLSLSGEGKKGGRVGVPKGPKSRVIRQHKIVQNQDLSLVLHHKFQCLEVDLNDQGLKIYQFSAAPSYESVQKEYEIVKNSMNPQQIFDFLHLHHQHCDALFDASEYFRLKGDYTQANSLIETLLYIYEDSLGYEFGKILEQPKMTMELSVNKYSMTFFMTLFKFTDILGKKGCYRSALEFSKLLLKLCPTLDPTGALMLLDFHCLSSQQYDYLIFFAQNFARELYKNKKYSIAYMPNYLYSSALSKFLKGKNLDKEMESQNKQVTEEDFQTAISSFQNDAPLNENCNVLMIQAILLFPSALIGLATKNDYAKLHVPNLEHYNNNQRKPFKDLLNLDFLMRESYLYWFLGQENDDDSNGLKKVIEVFIERNKILWKHSYIAQWIKEILGFIQNKIQDGTFDLLQFYKSAACPDENKQIVNLIPFQFRIYKSLLKSHFSDQTERLDFNAIFAENIGAQNQVQQNPLYNPINPNQGVLGVLFNSIFPWVHNPVVGQQQQGNHQDDFEEDFEDFQ